MSLSVLAPTRGATLGTVYGRGRFLAGTGIATGVTDNVDVDVSDYDLATVLVSMTGAATGDLTVAIFPFEEDLATPSIAPLPVTAGTVTLTGGHVAQAIQVNCTGLKGIRIAVTNHNAGGETIDYVDVFCGVTGTDF